jgi:hypothetical protein
VITVSLVVMFGAALVPVSTAAGANATSLGFAGYQATSQSASGSASVKFTVPVVQCNGQNAGNFAFFGSLLANLFPAAGILVNCGSGGTGPPSYLGVLAAGETPLVPRPGDLIKATVSKARTGGKATLTDVTQGLAESVSFASSHQGPTVMYDGVSTMFCLPTGCATAPVSNFGKIRMFDTTLNGVAPRTAGATAVNMQNGSTLEVATRALNASGNAWTEVWKAF